MIQTTTLRSFKIFNPTVLMRLALIHISEKSPDKTDTKNL